MRLIWRYHLMVVVGPFMVLTVGSWMMDRLSLGVEVDSYLFSYGFWVSAIPLSLLLTALVALTGRVCLSLAVSLLIVGGLCAINAQKIGSLASPLSVFDCYLFKSIDFDSLSLFAHYVNWRKFSLACVVFALGTALLLRIEKPLLSKHLLLRAFIFICVAGMAHLLLFGHVGRRIYDVDRLRVSASSPFLTQFHAGLLGSMFYASNDMDTALDEPIDRLAVQSLLARVRTGGEHGSVAGTGVQPDVVVIQSESFFNPDILNQVADTRVLVPTLHRAFAQGVSGSMTVPTFGGGTLRTEFEVLTGIPLAAYPRVQFPYLQISHLAIPGLASTFDKAGYKTVAIHGNSGEFWNRRYALKSLGFAKFITADEFGPNAYKDGLFLSDHSMTDEIINQLGQAGQPKFVFAISIEAHGPYKGVQVRDEAQRNAVSTPSGVSAAACREYSLYAYHIEEADRELGRLWDYLEHRKRPYVLVFYGDHLPGLEVVYHETTFRDGLPAERQRVPWVAVGSGLAGIGKQDIYAWMLPSEVLKLARVKGPEYLDVAWTAGHLALSSDDERDAHVLDELYSVARMNLNGEFGGSGGLHGAL